MTRRLALLAVFSLLAAAGASVADTITINGSRVILGEFNAAGASASSPCPVSTSTPATCAVGQCFFDSDATAGENRYDCTATNVWTRATGSHGVANYSQSFTSQTSVVLTHNLGTNNVVVVCYDSSEKELLPNDKTIAVASPYNVTVTFQTSRTGRCVVNGSAATAQQVQPMQLIGRKFGWIATPNNANSAFTAVSVPGAVAVGTASSQPALANRYYVRYVSGAVVGAQATAAAGHVGNYNGTRPAYRPRYASIILTDSAITTRRIWVGLTESTLFGLAVAAGPTASGIDFVAAAYEDGVNSGKWMCCSGDGTNFSCVDTGITVATSTEYAMLIDWSVTGTLNCVINGVVTSKTSNLSTAAVDIGYFNALETLDNNARNHQIAGMVYLDQN